ncbi:MAG: dual specificity protein phosphatase family protein, partial [Actinomycetales bacterium]|nr:dual specificity protein phosphatase family protein [Actinomycetales bacterium]
SAPALDDLPDDVDAVVSLCLVGRRQVPRGVQSVTFRLIDSPDPAENPNLDFVIADAARTVQSLRAQGKRVFLHCVRAESRTPTVAIAYSLLDGMSLEQAQAGVLAALPNAHPNRAFVAALERIAAGLETGS